jgi:glycosyltransferase involved in cell wall biosynthesis
VGSLKSYIEALDSRLGGIKAVSPKVSIIVTNYNYSNYIVDCLQSVSNQGYPDIECIVVDDHSEDDSVTKIRRFLDGDKSHVVFQLVTHETTRGQYGAFRTGLAHADGAFISFLDADDLLLTDFVSEHVRVHLILPPVAFTSSNQYQIDSKGQVIGGTHPDLHTHRTYRTVGTVSLHRNFWVWATTSSMMFRRSVLDYVLSSADDAFRKCADNYICHFCNILGGSILIPRVLGCYRRHQRNIFSNNPLIGGRLPTGDMRNHPAHHLVLDHICARLFDCSQRFIALLGVNGFLDILAKVTPPQHLWRNGHSARRNGVVGLRPFLNFYWIYSLLCIRKIIRLLRNRPSSVTLHDLEGAKPATMITSYASHQYSRRDAK